MEEAPAVYRLRAEECLALALDARDEVHQTELVEMALYMTKAAFHAERCGNELHRRNKPLGGKSFEHLNVLVSLLGGLGDRRRVTWLACPGLRSRLDYSHERNRC